MHIWWIPAWSKPVRVIASVFQGRCARRKCFCSSWAFRGLDDAHLHWGVLFALFRCPTQMLINSGNPVLDTPRNNALPAIGTSLSPVKLTHGINHHTVNGLSFPQNFSCHQTSLRNLMYVTHSTAALSSQLLWESFARMSLSWRQKGMQRCPAEGVTSVTILTLSLAPKQEAYILALSFLLRTSVACVSFSRI